MENRLSDSVVADSLDAGHQNLAWEPGPPSGFLAGIDIDALLANPDAEEIVPHLPAQALYYALKQKGVEDALDLLPMLSQDQVERMLDYDAWHRDELVPKKFFKFLKSFAEVSREQLFLRFSELDEEYQLAALQGFFRIHEVENAFDLSEDLQDRAYRMPCDKVFYEIVSEDADEIAFLEELMESAKENNLRYAYSLIGHSAYLPPGEMLAQVSRFRRGRLEDDGFVNYEDSLSIFEPIDRQALLQKWSATAQSMDLNELAVQGGSGLFLDAVLRAASEHDVSVDELFALHQGFLYLANALCSATHVEPDDIPGLNRLLEQGKAILSLGLEYIAQGQLEVGIAALRGESSRTLFRVGLSLVDRLRAEVLKSLEHMHWPRVERLQRYYIARQWGQILLELDRHWIQNVGIQAGEILKGLFNRFPMVPMRTMQDQNRIIFAPIINLAALVELERNLQTILGTFQIASRTGLSLQQPIDVILREAAMESIRQDGDGGIPQLLQRWRAQLQTTVSAWWVGDKSQQDEIMDASIDMIHEDLHGLIVLPGVRRSHSTDYESEVPQS